jgi:predicted dehydrogenase
MINAAIVGLGWWGKTLVESVQGKSDVIRFTAAHNRTRAKGEEFCRAKNLEQHDDISTILADPSIDAVVYAAKHNERAGQVVQTAKAGKHVFVEKPFALELRAADEALNAAAKAGVVLAVGYQRRFHPSMVELKKRLREGSLGTITQCAGEASAPVGLRLPKDSWRLDPAEVPAGGLTALGVHVVDGMIDLFGRIDEVYCMSKRRVATHIDDGTTIVFGFASGMVGSLLMSTASAINYRFAVYGTKALAEISTPSLDLLRVVMVPEVMPHGQPASVPPEIIETKNFDPLRAELEAFGNAIRTKTPYPIPVADIRHGVEVFEAIVSSSRSGQPVKISAR